MLLGMKWELSPCEVTLLNLLTQIIIHYNWLPLEMFSAWFEDDLFVATESQQFYV